MLQVSFGSESRTMLPTFCSVIRIVCNRALATRQTSTLFALSHRKAFKLYVKGRWIDFDSGLISLSSFILQIVARLRHPFPVGDQKPSTRLEDDSVYVKRTTPQPWQQISGNLSLEPPPLPMKWNILQILKSLRPSGSANLWKPFISTQTHHTAIYYIPVLFLLFSKMSLAALNFDGSHFFWGPKSPQKDTPNVSVT